MRCASALRCPWLVMGSVPPVDSMTISAQKTPVEICTEATLDMGMLSSLEPNSRDFVRTTRCGLTTILVGKKKLPRVQREAANVSAGDESIAVRSGEAIRLNENAPVPNYSIAQFPNFPISYTHSSAPLP